MFAWHARPGAIIRLMPPWQPVRVAREAAFGPGRAGGAAAAGRAALGGRPSARRATTRRTQFADVLHRCRWRRCCRWRHTHQFAPRARERPWSPTWSTRRCPARALRPMFGYRHRQLAADLAAHARCPGRLPGAADGRGHRVERPGRHRAGRAADHRRAPGDPAGPPAAAARRGALLAAGRPRPGAAERRRRGDPPGRRLDRAAGSPRTASGRSSTAGSARPAAWPRSPRPPSRTERRLRAFVTASAIGIYGPDRGDEMLTEASDRGDGFLADVVADWEDAAGPADRGGHQDGPGPHRHRADPARRHAAPAVPAVRGRPRRPAGRRHSSGWPGSAWTTCSTSTCGPSPIPACPGRSTRSPRSRCATPTTPRTLARVLRRPALLPVPAFGPRLLLGAEGAREIAQASQLVRPAAADRRPGTSSATRAGGGAAARTRPRAHDASPANPRWPNPAPNPGRHNPKDRRPEGQTGPGGRIA